MSQDGSMFHTVACGNPKGTSAEAFVRNVQAGGLTLGLKIEVVNASTAGDLDSVFATLGRLSAGGLVIAPDQVLYALSERIAALAIQHRLPTSFQYRQAAAAGGLMSYGANAVDLFRLVGAYTGRILRGEAGAKPADLPVVQSTKFEFVINRKTAKELGLTVPPKLVALADEVIE